MKQHLNYGLVILYFAILPTITFGQWSLSGNSIASGNFLGTTNNEMLLFKRNASHVFSISTGNTFLLGPASVTPQSGQYSFAIGDFRVANTYLGSSGNVSADYSTAIGNSTVNAASAYSFAIGNNSGTEESNYCFAIGNSAMLYNTGPNTNSFVIGNTVSQEGGTNNFIVGNDIIGGGSSIKSFSIGNNISVLDGTNRFILGSGLTSNLLSNSTDNSLAIGFNSNLATLFVGPSAGVSTTGNVGIGTSSPAYKLDVLGDINISQSKVIRIQGTPMLSAIGNIANGNIALGQNAGITTASNYCVYIGNLAAGSITHSTDHNTYIGNASGQFNDDGTQNTFIGSKSGQNTGQTSNSVFIGYSSGLNAQSGSQNTFVGINTGKGTHGNENTFIGAEAGQANVTGENNTYIGSHSGYVSTGSNNTYNGAYAGYANTSGTQNTFIGFQTGYANTSGNNNTSLGYGAGNVNSTGSNNTYIGYNANGSATLTNATAIGYNSSVTTNNSLILGNGANIGIGVTAPIYKLHLEGGDAYVKEKVLVGSNSGDFISFRYAGRVKVFHDNTGVAIGTQSCAGAFNNSGTTIDDVIGVAGFGKGSTGKNYGVQGFGAANCGTSSSFGVYGYCGGGRYNYGVYGRANGESYVEGCTTSVFHAVHGEVDFVWPAGNPNFWAGYFNGDFYYSGAWKSSDQKLKENIKDFENAMDKIRLLKPHTYNYKHTDELKGLTLPYGENMGFVAQELELVFPNLVRETLNPEVTDEKGKIKYPSVQFKSVDYISIIPVLTAGIQEQDELISKQAAEISLLKTELDDQKKLIDQLMEDMKNIKSSLSDNKINMTTSTGEILINKDAPYLGNAQPNPFKNETTIEYYIPNNILNADICIYDSKGIEIYCFRSLGKGKNQISINNIINMPGAYSYVLIVDGKQIDSKKVIKY